MPESPATPLPQTPSQTVGPFFGYALQYRGDSELVASTATDAIRLHGTVLDGAGEPVPDALIELWQADGSGAIVHETGSLHRDGFTFTGFGRAAVDPGGHYSFSTVKPAAARASSAPYVLVTVFARGLLHHLFTRAYFSDEAEANGRDPLLATVAPERRDTLIAQADGARSYRFDIRIQGERETVFLDFGNEG